MANAAREEFIARIDAALDRLAELDPERWDPTRVMANRNAAREMETSSLHGSVLSLEGLVERKAAEKSN